MQLVFPRGQVSRQWEARILAMEAGPGFAKKVCLSIDLNQFDAIIRPNLQALRRAPEFQLKFLRTQLLLPEPGESDRGELSALLSLRMCDSFWKKRPKT